MPVASTTTSASIGPCSVSTPVTRPSATLTSVTETPSITRAPRAFAPLARAMVVSTGDVWPSRGMNNAPTRSSVRRRGQRAAASSRSITRVSTPTPSAMVAPRRISSHRSGSAATEIDPGVRYPVAWPVSSSNSSKRRTE